MGQCLVCHNETEKRLITYIQDYQGKWVAVKDVPADICPICGEQYFDPDTADRNQNTIYLQRGKHQGHILNLNVALNNLDLP